MHELEPQASGTPVLGPGAQGPDVSPGRRVAAIVLLLGVLALASGLIPSLNETGKLSAIKSLTSRSR